MRTLVLLHDAYGGHGGIAKFNRDLIGALAAHPATVAVVALPRHMPLPPGPLPAKVTFDTGGLGGKSAWFANCLRWRAVGGRFDLVIAAHINLLPFAWLWRGWGRRRTGVPKIVLTMHGTDGWTAPDGGLARRLATRADAYIAVSAVTRDRFIHWSRAARQRFHILPNGVDLARFTPGPKNPALLARYGLDGKRVVMTLGRMSAKERAKGFDQIIEALPALAAECPDIAYLAAGDGDDRARLMEKAWALGVAERVVFTGHVAEDEKPDHYRLADLYAMPSRFEGFGIAFLEALACGLPVIGSQADGGREALLSGRLGMLVDPNDRSALIAAIRDGLYGLIRPHGTVPPELADYSEEAFRRRALAIVDRVAGTA